MVFRSPSRGFPISFGVFQSYYTQHPLFETSDNIPTIGALVLGLPFLLLCVTSPLCLRYSHHLITIMFSGWLMFNGSLLLASLATQTWQLVLTQGLLYGVGWCICYTPVYIILNEWFDKRRGLAYGIYNAASGVSGLVLPFALQLLLRDYGFRVTLRLYVLAYAAISAPAFWLITPRLPAHIRVQPKTPRATFLQERQRAWYSVLLTPSAIVISTSIFLQGLIFPYPTTFLPSYASTLGLDASQASSLLSISALCQVPGLILLGWFSDHVSIHIPHSLSALISGASSLFLWGPAKSFPSLALFSSLWGFFGVPYSVFWSRISLGIAKKSVVSKREDEIVRRTVILFVWFNLLRGIADIAAGPISTILLNEDVDRTAFGLGRYADVVSFSGFILLISACGGFLSIYENWRMRET
ncbi:MFS monocarboxylate [Stagonosporopsis vannaccii]|nr:MFS monocarboxylate [Stagonosporopsis vannaccii]